jgi:hypothetical protein
LTWSILLDAAAHFAFASQSKKEAWMCGAAIIVKPARPCQAIRSVLRTENGVWLDAPRGPDAVDSEFAIFERQIGSGLDRNMTIHPTRVGY